MSNTHEALKLADAYADASFDQGLNQRTEDPAPEKAREALAKELNAMHALIVQMAEAIGEALIAANTGRILAGGYKEFAAAAKDQATQYLEQK